MILGTRPTQVWIDDVDISPYITDFTIHKGVRVPLPGDPWCFDCGGWVVPDLGSNKCVSCTKAYSFKKAWLNAWSDTDQKPKPFINLTLS